MRKRSVVPVVVLLIAVAVMGLGSTPAAGDRESSVVRDFQHGSFSVGYRNTCAVTTTGKVRCWGRGFGGRNGHNSTANVGDTPGTSIIAAGDVPIGGDVASISSGAGHTCAVLTTRKVRCWGIFGAGVLGHDTAANIGDDPTRSIIAAGDVPIGGDVAQISASSSDHVCALLTTKKVRCWGSGGQGQLGHDSANTIGGTGPGSTPIVANGDVPVGGDVAAITVGDYHTCALLTTKKVRCWGDNLFGKLGYGLDDRTPEDDVGNGTAPSIIAQGDVPVGGDVSAISAGGNHTCALLTNGKIRCWGDNQYGQLGYGNTDNVGRNDGKTILLAGDVPVGGDAVAIAAGFDHTCALLTTGKVRCWGLADFGRLGYNNETRVGDGVGPSIIQAGDVQLGGDAVAVSAGDDNTCALLSTGKLRCWGGGFDGQNGYNSLDDIADSAMRPITTDVPLGADLWGQVGDVSLGVTPASLTPNVGTEVEVTLTLTNAGPDPSTGVTVAAPIPAGLTLGSAAPSQGSYASGTWTVGTLPSGSTATLALKVTPTESGARTITAEVTSSASKDLDSTPGNGVADEDDTGSSTITATTVIVPPASTPTPGPTPGATVTPSPTATPATPTPAARCKVPKLKGKSLAAAKTALTKARCKLGKVRKPKGRLPKNRKLVVSTSSPKAGVSKPRNTKVNLVLKRVKR